MQAGVTPRTYLVRVEGEDLTQLKVGQRSEDFVVSELSSTLLNHPGRNQRLYQALEGQGMRRVEPSPSGRQRLEPSLGFAADLRHAAMLAQDYLSYFGSGEGLRGRRLCMLGAEGGRIGSRELQEALQAYRRGESDGIVAIVSGQSGAQRDLVLQAVGRGEIEAVFTVDALVEGADLHMFKHQLGARPTFSRIKRGQERGRINRRGPDEVLPQGELLQDPPRILFDVVDRYRSDERQLIPYGLIMGVRHLEAKAGELFDAFAGRVAQVLDRSGRGVSRVSPEALLEGRSRPAQPSANPPEPSPFQPLAEALRELLEGQYAGQIEEMALDLGEPIDFVESLLEGRGWDNSQWFMRRLASLLYQNRESLLDRYNEESGLRDEAVSLEDIEALRDGFRLLQKWEGSSAPESGVRVGEIEITESSLQRLSRGNVGALLWRSLWVALGNYFLGKIGSGSSEEIRSAARDQFLTLYGQLGRHLGWSDATGGGQDQLLQAARYYSALRFGGILPWKPGIEGVPTQGSNSPLTRWLQRERIEYWGRHNSDSLYSQVRNLLLGLGGDSQEVNSWIEGAIFAEQGWSRQATNPQERLLLEARLRVAERFGGDLPRDHGIEGVSIQNNQSALTRWLQGETVEYSINVLAQSFYSQVRSLLLGLGAEHQEVSSWIENTIFAERGWSLQATTPQERLLLEARRRVAECFGGILPRRPGIDGVSVQTVSTPLSRWLQQGEVDYSTKNTPISFYSQVRSLLLGLGGKPQEINSWIESAIFGERGWSLEATNAQERLLLEARRRVADRWGGLLPRNPGIEGVSVQSGHSPLARWLQGGRLGYSPTNIPQAFYSQVRSLLIGLGGEPRDVNSWIENAIFAERGWSQQATNAQERLLLEARRRVAQRFGGVLPGSPEVEGVPSQDKRGLLTQWLRGEQVNYYSSSHVTPQSLYSQVRNLLLGMEAELQEVSTWIESAIFSERSWSTQAVNAQERLLLEARRRVAQRFGGVLPMKTELEGVSAQDRHSPLARWLQGEQVEYSRRFTSQVLYLRIRSLLLGLGAEPQAVSSWLEDAIFAERGWSLHATNAQDRLLLEARRRVAERFGGALPSHPEIEGVPGQSPNAPLTRWLSGSPVHLTDSLSSQIWALLSHEGHMSTEVIDSLISEASAE